MKHRKPDILLILALVTGVGVLVTGYAQSLFHREPAMATSMRIDDSTGQLNSSEASDLAIKESSGSTVVIDNRSRIN